MQSIRSLAALLLLLFPFSAAAAPPDVKAILPAGGQRGQTVTVSVTGNVGTPPAAVWCSRPEIKVEPGEAGKYTVQIPAETPPGVVRLRWQNAEGASAQRAFVVGTIPEIVEKEPNNELANATPVEMPRIVVNGVLEKNGEIDVFAVPLKKGETLVAALDANRSLGSPMDGLLQIVSPKGFVLEQNDDAPGYDPLATHTAEVDGTHYVRVFAFPVETNTNVAYHGGPDYVYRLTLTTGPALTHTMPMAVQRGVATPLKLFGWNIPADRGEFAIPSDAPDDFLLTRDDLANVLPVRVVYHVSLPEAAQPAGAGPITIAVPTTITGTISARRESDAYEFTATKGQRLSIESEARSIASLLDPVVRITDAAGKTLQEVDDSQRGQPDSEFVWTAPADGTYRVEIRDLYEDGGPRYFYRLTIEPEVADVNLSVAADAFTLPADKPLEIPVTIDRKAGFKDELEIAIVGLPETLEAAAVKSVMGNDTSKAVKLVIARKAVEGAAAPLPGIPIRIVARSAATPPVERFAEAPLPALKSRSRDLWLTVLPAK